MNTISSVLSRIHGPSARICVAPVNQICAHLLLGESSSGIARRLSRMYEIGRGLFPSSHRANESVEPGANVMIDPDDVVPIGGSVFPGRPGGCK